ncbi:hypothetical protein ACSVDE_04415 [Pseudalkalibacillus sp. Hm43]|uniref:hypothetical protein n=1 Tax=Pseudalkalibacillus sp. Hm43 TaxID=3450742 RepID=UPI003F44520A
MASSMFVYMLKYYGQLVSEVILDDTDTVLTNVVLTELGGDYAVFNQGGSGGMGQIIVPLENIVAIVV